MKPENEEEKILRAKTKGNSVTVLSEKHTRETPGRDSMDTNANEMDVLSTDRGLKSRNFDAADSDKATGRSTALRQNEE